jgi:thiol-disulfide isomerase/thioredoxin
MITRVKISVVVALMMGFCALPGQAQTLGIGDSAPKLEVKAFVKGEPVSYFEPGKNYVVEFWATWCGPCKTSIPHLSELQKKHPTVAFIGVSIWEQNQNEVTPFVKEMGEKMAYRVAIDSVPEKAEADKGAMAKNWMTAAGQAGIPAAFVVNKEGKIAWIGHPMELEKPLEKIVAGTWDMKEASEEQRKTAEMQAKLAKAQSKLQDALRSSDSKKLVAVVDEIISDVPETESIYGPVKLTALIKLDEQEKALDYAKKLGKSDLSKQPEGLNGLAWAILDPDAGIKPSSKLIEFALATARRADELAETKDAGIADTLAKAYFDSGEVAKAVETQERAIRLAKGGKYEPAIGEFTDRLEKYKKKAK